MVGVKTVLISGAITGDVRALEGFFDAMHATVEPGRPSDEAIERGRENLDAKAREVAAALLGVDR